MILMDSTKYRNMLLYSIISFLMSSLSFLIIPFSRFEGTIIQRTLAYMVGFFFWTGLVIGMIITYFLSKIRKKCNNKNYSLPGFFCFFKNKKSWICDIIMLVSAMLFIIIKTYFTHVTLAWSAALSLLTFSVYTHSVLNGNNYAFAVKKGVHL